MLATTRPGVFLASIADYFRAHNLSLTLKNCDSEISNPNIPELERLFTMEQSFNSPHEACGLIYWRYRKDLGRAWLFWC